MLPSSEDKHICNLTFLLFLKWVYFQVVWHLSLLSDSHFSHFKSQVVVVEWKRELDLLQMFSKSATPGFCEPFHLSRKVE